VAHLILITESIFFRRPPPHRTGWYVCGCQFPHTDTDSALDFPRGLEWWTTFKPHPANLPSQNNANQRPVDKGTRASENSPLNRFSLFQRLIRKNVLNAAVALARPVQPNPTVLSAFFWKNRNRVILSAEIPPTTFQSDDVFAHAVSEGLLIFSPPCGTSPTRFSPAPRSPPTWKVASPFLGWFFVCG